MDGAVFEIIKELEEIQQLNERSLLNKRIKVSVKYRLWVWITTPTIYIYI